MAKAKLIFDLSDPDERRAFLCAAHSTELALSIWHITYNLRREIEEIVDSLPLDDKYVEENGPAGKIMDKIRDSLPNVNIDDLIV